MSVILQLSNNKYNKNKSTTLVTTKRLITQTLRQLKEVIGQVEIPIKRIEITRDIINLSTKKI